jgi:hypothetical protein
LLTGAGSVHACWESGEILFHFHSLIKAVSSGETLDVMPPFDLIAFIGFPAGRTTRPSRMRKIDQTLLIILQLDLSFQLSAAVESSTSSRITRPARKTAAAGLSTFSSLSGTSWKLASRRWDR